VDGCGLEDRLSVPSTDIEMLLFATVSGLTGGHSVHVELCRLK
jgi:hypothetical protein